MTEDRCRTLTNFECRSWIGGRHKGRLAHQTGRGARAVVVNYAATDRQLVFRLPEYHEICQYAPGRQITLSVCASTDHTSTEVFVTGIGYLDDDHERIVDGIDFDEHWPTGVSTHVICLDLDDVRGSTRTTVPKVG
jgi:hypothetical protein